MHQARVLFEEETAPFFQLAYPNEPLRSLIAYYFEINHTKADAQPLSIKCLPNMTGLINVSLSQVDWLSRNEFTGKQTLVSGANVFGCVTDSLESLYTAGVHEFYIKLKPGAIQQLTNLPGSELANQFAQLTDVFTLPNFSESIQNASSFADRIKITEAAFLPFTSAANTDWRYKLVQQAVAHFDTTDSLNKPQQHLYRLCHDLGVSYKSLHRHFTTVVGYSPKYCQQLIRFKRGLKQYKQYGSTYDFETIGYTDFSHFVRECKQLTQQGPSAL
ncbi:hypothetical protein ACFSUS_06375 [Spirosoma soli]|uniref:AraC family transcriptional regulator n=1 Tax=Spirosoma soli TaxID=1770529 RepID=A0ABW5M296_9BACT